LVEYLPALYSQRRLPTKLPNKKNTMLHTLAEVSLG